MRIVTFKVYLKTEQNCDISNMGEGLPVEGAEGIMTWN